MKQENLCYLIKSKDGAVNEVLLAMKKRGFGVGKLNGIGGKLDEGKGDKDILEAMIREAKEEIGVDLINIKKVALFKFYFPHKVGWDRDVHVFLVDKWSGEPQESEEMKPSWINIKEIPLDKMWDDDKYWLQDVLAGKMITGEFIFNVDGKVAKHNIKFVNEI